MKKNLLIFLISILPGLNMTITAQTRKYSNEFLNIGVDAAAMGMGNTVVSSVRDVTSGYWNPAGLVSVSGYQGALMHAAWFANIAQYDYAGFAMPLSNNNFLGLSLIRFGVDDIMDTTLLIDSQGNIDYNRINLFSAADYGLIFSFARKNIFKNFSYGVNTKIIYRRIGDFADSYGFGFDAGFQLLREKWSFGVMVKDVTTTFNSWSIDKDKLEQIQNAIPGENQQVPETIELTLPKAQLGITRNWAVSRDIGLATSMDLQMRFTRTNDLLHSDFISLTPAAGLEFDYLKFVFLRMGINNLQWVNLYDDRKSLSWQPNAGVGFLYKGIQVDYALTNIASTGNALYSHVFSVKIDFNAVK